MIIIVGRIITITGDADITVSEMVNGARSSRHGLVINL